MGWENNFIRLSKVADALVPHLFFQGIMDYMFLLFIGQERALWETE